MTIQIVEQRTDDYRKELYRRMCLLAMHLMDGREFLRGDEHQTFILWRRVLGLPADVELSVAAKMFPVELAKGDPIPEDEIPGLRRVLDEYLMKLSDKLVENGAKDCLAQFEVPIDKYQAAVEIYGMTAKVEYIHRTTGAVFTLHNIFFDDSGKILRAVLSV